MRKCWLIPAAVLMITFAGAPRAFAAPATSKTLKAAIEANLAKLVVLHDGHHHFIVVDPTSIDSDVFYSGDGKTFYAQRALGGSSDGSTGAYERTLWSPRVGHEGIIERSANKWKMVCGTSARIGGVAPPYEHEASLVILGEKEATALLRKGTFKPPRWERQAYFLARDNRGVYYYIDAIRPPHVREQPYGFRLFIGKKRRMKKARMTDIVHDSAGDIFSTRSGDLRFVTTAKGAEWIRKKRVEKLTKLPVMNNIILIYRDLGVYKGPLGTPCDDI